MQHKFCDVFTFKKQMYVARRANANGPDCTVWPIKQIDRGTTVGELATEIASAIDEYKSLGRSILASEWEVRNQQLLEFFGEKTVATFQRKKKEVTVRLDTREGTFSLFDGGSGQMLCQQNSFEEVAQSIIDRLGEP